MDYFGEDECLVDVENFRMKEYLKSLWKSESQLIAPKDQFPVFFILYVMMVAAIFIMRPIHKKRRDQRYQIGLPEEEAPKLDKSSEIKATIKPQPFDYKRFDILAYMIAREMYKTD